jgi:hypothetical protein
LYVVSCKVVSHDSMSIIFSVVYIIFFLFWIIASLFVVYHIVRYSLDKKAAVLMLLIFISVTSLLLLTNVILFSSLRLDEMFQLNFY